MSSNALTIVGALAGAVAIVGALTWFELAERNYVQTHDCRVVEHRPGYFTAVMSADGKGRTSVNQIWHGPRERWACEDGSLHWTDAL